jgi:hypothetical protein
MANYQDAFEEGEDFMPEVKDFTAQVKDFTAEDLEAFLATNILSEAVLGSRKLRRTIAGVHKRELRSDKSGGTELTPVLYFSECSEVLPLKVYNLRTLNEVLGDPPAWVGAVIQFFFDTNIIMEGEPLLRLEVLKAPATKPAPKGPDFDDENSY